jgi:predicted nucleotidyltransferase
MIRLPSDFKEFLQLLNSEKVEYLLVGGYAVGYYGYPRATGDMDVWIAVNPVNADALVRVCRQFGFSAEAVSKQSFLAENKVIRMGIPPVRIDLVTRVDGIEFAQCFNRRILTQLDGVEVNLIGLEDLKANKRAVGRPKDFDDLEHL